MTTPANAPEILYVDDEALNVMVFSKLFEKRYRVHTAASGPEALQQLQENPEVKVLVSDMRMPDMNGLELITQAKRDYPDLKCFILSGFDITNEIREALEQQVIEQYFRKPIGRIEPIESAIDSSIYPN